MFTSELVKNEIIRLADIWSAAVSAEEVTNIPKGVASIFAHTPFYRVASDEAKSLLGAWELMVNYTKSYYGDQFAEGMEATFCLVRADFMPTRLRALLIGQDLPEMLIEATNIDLLIIFIQEKYEVYQLGGVDYILVPEGMAVME